VGDEGRSSPNAGHHSNVLCRVNKMPPPRERRASVAPLVSEPQFFVRVTEGEAAKSVSSRVMGKMGPSNVRSDSLTDDHLKSHILPVSPAQDVCQQ
jgi:hypothetical protein